MDFPIVLWLAVVGLVTIFASLRGVHLRRVVGGALLAFVLSVMAWSTVWSIGPVASVVFVAFVAVWLTLLWFVRAARHRGA